MTAMAKQQQQKEARPIPRLVRVTEVCFIDECLRNPGDVVETIVPITPGGPFVDANEAIAANPARPTRRATKSASGGAGVQAPEWTTQGHKERNGIDGPVGMHPGRSESSIEVSPP